MVVSMIPAVGAKEAKAGEPVNVYVKISSDLSDKYKVPNIHYWGNASTDWPGVQMNGTPNMGWYYYEVPAGATSFLVVNTADNTTSPQTDDATLPSEDGWFELIEDSNAEKGYSLKTVTKPSAWVDVPTEDTSGSGSSGSTDTNTTSDSTGSGTTDTNTTSDSTGSGTTDTNTTSDSTGSESTKTDTEEGVYKLHFLNAAGWENVGVWIWLGKENAFTEWPGVEVKKEVGSNKWFEYDYKGSLESINVIFNEFKEGGAETPALKEIWSDKEGKNVPITPGEYWIIYEVSTNPDNPEETSSMVWASTNKEYITEEYKYDGQGLPTLDWAEEAEALEEAKTGSTTTIDMGTETVADKAVFDAIKGKDVNVELKLSNGLAWVINGKDITTAKDLDLGATLNTKNIPEDTVEALKKDNEFASTTTLSLDFNGDFGAKLQLLYPAGKDKAGKKFQLFYYNPTTKALEKQGDVVEADENGNVPFTFTHASDYVIAEEKAAAAPAATVAPGKKADVIVHVNFGTNEAWSAINAYSWTKGGDVKFLGEWPGSAMSKNEKNAGWYSIAFDVNGADEVNIIFNDGNGTQTVDLKLSAATGEFWYTLGEKDADGKFAATESTTKPDGWVESEVTSSNGTGATGTSSPKTGDNSKAPIAVAVMALAIAGGVIAYRKREMFI
ncbi:MAG: starch-binding protein [Lachnospiraceae bacterium]|nr:starch-binding protein [Lachnospiraceae bacterium]